MRPGYKQTEAGIVPENWEVRKFSEVTNLITCGIAATPDYVPDGSGYPFLSSSNVKSGRIVWNNYKYIPEELHKRLYRNNPPQRGDVIYSRVGTIGEAAVIDVDFEFSIYVSLTLIKPKPTELDSRFLIQLLNSESYKRRANDQVYLGGGVGNLNVEVVREYPIILPPMGEQRAIAAALGDVDGLIAGLEKLIAKKRAVKTAVIQQLLTGKMRLPGFNGRWQTATFGMCCLPRRERVAPENLDSSVQCIELENIEQGTGKVLGSVQANEQVSIKTFFCPDDVLFGKLRSYLRKYWLADRKGVCSTEIWVLVAEKSMILPRYLYQIVRTDLFIDTASEAYGTHMPRADWNVVKDFEFELPPLKEQRAIAEVLSDLDAEINALEARRDKTKAIKQGVMQELLTGRTRLV